MTRTAQDVAARVASPARAGTRESPARAGAREWLALAVLMLPVLLVSVDNTVLNFALPAISEALRPSGVALLWIVDAYPLVLAGLLVAMGSLADRIGRRRLLLVGTAGFAALSAAAAFAPSAELLVAARAALGVFGAMIMPATLSLLRSIFADRAQRRLAIAVWAAGFAAGAALGPIVGGILLERFWWGSVLLMAVPVLAPLLVAAPLLVPESRDPHPGPVDLVSIALSLAALAPIVYAVKTLATEGLAAHGALAAAGGIAAAVLFVRRQRRRSIPMLDMGLFAVPAFSGAVLVNLGSILAFVGGLFFITQHLQLVLGLSPVAAGVALLPGLATSVIAGLGVVPVARRVSPRIVVPAALLVSASGYSLIALRSGELDATTLAVAFLAIGLGIGAAETVTNELILQAAPVHKAGAASAVSETAYEVGAVLGTAVLGTIVTAVYRTTIVLPSGLSADRARAASETIGGAASVASGLPPGAAERVMTAAAAAFDAGVPFASALGALVVSAAAVLAALALRPARA